jgi:hypothetical protein
VYLVRHKGIQHSFSVAATGHDLNPWMGFDKARNEVWQKVLGNRLRSPYGQFSCLRSRGFRDRGKSPIGDLFNLIRQRQQHLPSGRELNPPSASVEERNSEFILEGLHLLSHRRLRQQ